MLNINRLHVDDADFQSKLKRLLTFDAAADAAVIVAVERILAAVKNEGDAALLRYTQQFDNLKASSVAALELQAGQLQAAVKSLPVEQFDALRFAAERIRAYADHQKLRSWSYTEADGTLLGQKISALDRVGLYVPGGKAAYPSSVLMNAIPAKVAGVTELIMVVPAPQGRVEPIVMAAAAIAGVDRVFTIGGAQAVAALAYGTKTIPAVDKIVGPGNIYVATAKRLLFGVVGIDMLAGPSEIVVVCDGQTEPDWVVMDLFSQAEHDENAQAILISPDSEFLHRVNERAQALLADMPRRSIIARAMNARGCLIQVHNLQQAMDVVNLIAPEHLELSFDNAEHWLEKVRHAGAIFLGRYTAEAIGDYCAGPNHVLPTSGTARFASPLGVYDFQKRSSIIACTADSAANLGRTAAVLAEGEGLIAHARSAGYRVKS